MAEGKESGRITSRFQSSLGPEVSWLPEKFCSTTMKVPSVLVPLGLAWLLGFVPVAPSRAGGLLGALYDTCLGSLGEPVNYTHLTTPGPGAEVYAFRQPGWVITVFFWKHQAHLIVY